MNLGGYELELLHDDGDFALYRARQPHNPVPVLARLPTRTTSQSIARLEHEYALASMLDPHWAAQPLTLDRSRVRPMLLLDDDGGEPLDCSLGPLELKRFLLIAVYCAKALGHVHRCGLVHKDIKPANVLVNSNGKVRLTGFGLAAQLPHELDPPTPPDIVTGSFAYMAPEQTGRINRSIDARSDLYSFGITLYEMLTGSLPFNATDAAEWIHCHIARRPTPPGERIDGVPEAVENIILKLLAKAAEDRYQSAAGVEADLESCRVAWDAHQEIDPFTLGAHDVSERLLIPEKLYGREAQTAAIVAAFDRIAAGAPAELVLISGYAGIGKSSIVNQLHHVLVQPRGLFAAGKFDQYKRGIPYVPFAQAFQSLVRDLLSKSDLEIDRWRHALEEALAPNGQLIVSLVPELALIIGEQPPVPTLPPQDAQNRFQLVFRRFLSVFAQPEHPLALFIDDLQWLDAATLDLLEHLATYSDVRHVLLVGAYRDNEVEPSHPLTRTLKTIRNAGGKVQEIALTPLTTDYVTQLVAESLSCKSARAEPLAQLVHRKTGGNPFFTIQFLRALADQKLLTFDHDTVQWSWDLSHIRAQGFTENIVDLMAAALGRLPDATRDALAKLACLGNAVELTVITRVYGESEEAIRRKLWEAVQAGLLFRVKDAYAFAHDRVQEAAYALIPVSERPGVHLRIGRALASRATPEAPDEAIFDIVIHLNRGATLITSEAEREQTIALNLIAGKRAMRSTAYASARTYLAQGAAMLPSDAWVRRYDETFDLYLVFSECEYLAGDFLKADVMFDMILGQAHSNLDRAKVFSLRMQLYQLAGRYDESFGVARDALRDFGIVLPESDEDLQVAIDAALQEIPLNLAGRAIEDLVDAPVAAAPATRAIINLLVEAMPCAFAARPVYYPLITLKAVNLSLRHGNTDNSSFAYGNYSLMLASGAADIPTAVKFSEMSLRLNEKFGNQRLYGKLLHLHASHINFWRSHMAANQPLLEKATVACMEVGDLVFAGNLAFNAVWQAIETGTSLEDVQALSEKYAVLARESHNDAVHETIRAEQQLVASLRGKTTETLKLNDDEFDGAACFAALTRANWGCGIVVYHVVTLMLAFLDGRYAEALTAAREAEAMLIAARALPIEATFHFFHVLTLTALYADASIEEQYAHRNVLAAKLKMFELWAEHCPENYRNRHMLVLAELARLDGRDLDAMRLYEHAVHSAHENGFVHNEGMVNELAGRFYLDRELKTNAHACLRNARHCFALWGADGKVAQLDERYPRLVAPQENWPMATPGTEVRQFDAATLLKASQALSSEIELPGLIERLMTIALQAAGADRGLLIIARDNGYRIEAEARVVGDKILLNHEAVAESPAPAALLRYVIHTQKSVIIDDALRLQLFSDDEYLSSGATRSVFCLPLVRQGKLGGLLYLENTVATNVFTARRSALLDLLASQAAISLENARLYADLREREIKVRRLVESNIIAVYISDFEGRIIDANDAFLRLVDYSREDLLSGLVRWTELTPPEWRSRDELVLTELKATRTAQPFEKEYFRKDGSRVPVLIGVAAFGEQDDECVAFVLDLTEQRRAQQEVRDGERRNLDLQMALAHSNRVATMGHLSASIAHEVKQPIAAIAAHASAALRWLGAQPPNLHEARETLTYIVSDSLRANQIVDRTRAFFKKEPQRKDGLDINETILELIAFMRNDAHKHGIDVEVELLEGLPRIQGDRVQLQQVMLNLMINAIEAMSEINVNERALSIRTSKADADELCVTVEDSGPGLDPEHFDGVFETFYTTKPNGLGMGLPICRSIIESHGGRLWASAKSPSGAIFQFTLPTQDGSVHHPDT
jgi:PAS domain S-box-containing protein